MKIIILDHEPFTDRKSQHYFIKEFLMSGIEIEFWSLWKILPYSKGIAYQNHSTEKFVKYYTSKNTFLADLKAINPSSTFIIVETWFNSDSLYMFQQLRDNNLKWARIEYYHNPAVNFYASDGPVEPRKLSLKAKILELVRIILIPKNLKYYYLQKFKEKKFRELITSDLSFITGNFSGNFNLSKKYVPIDYFDVEIFKTEKEKESILPYPYVVFADIYLGKHPDLEMVNGNNYLDIELYYKKLNHFFDQVEEKLNMPVVIAAHPKSDYKNNEFNGRLCIKNETANLIINSKLMIQHCSLSISFALLNNIKVIQFYDNSFMENSVLIKLYESIKVIGLKTNTSYINIDDEMDIKSLYNIQVDKKKYKEVLQNYFLKNKEESLGQSNFEIVFKNIKQILDKN
jgi:hypothetical protein